MIELEQSLQTLGGQVGDVKEEIAEIKENVANVKVDTKNEITNAFEGKEEPNVADIRNELAEIKESVEVVKTMINLLQLNMSGDQKEVESDI